MEPFNSTAKKKKRNIFLLILCILVFIDAGSSFFQMLLMPVYSKGENAEMALNIYKNMGSEEMTEQMSQIFAAAQALPSWYFYLSSIPFALAIIGAAFVLRKNPLGFHLYVVSQILAFACQNLLLKEPFNLPWISILCSICIAVCFYFQFKDTINTDNIGNEPNDYQ